MRAEEARINSYENLSEHQRELIEGVVHGDLPCTGKPPRQLRYFEVIGLEREEEECEQAVKEMRKAYEEEEEEPEGKAKDGFAERERERGRKRKYKKASEYMREKDEGEEYDKQRWQKSSSWSEKNMKSKERDSSHKKHLSSASTSSHRTYTPPSSSPSDSSFTNNTSTDAPFDLFTTTLIDSFSFPSSCFSPSSSAVPYPVEKERKRDKRATPPESSSHSESDERNERRREEERENENCRDTAQSQARTRTVRAGIDHKNGSSAISDTPAPTYQVTQFRR